MRRPSSVSVRVDRVVVCTVAYGLSATCIGMCRGAPCGRARPRTVWITFGGAHDVPWEVKSASLEHFLPPWTVTRQVWTDSLKPQHSGISTDIILFSDIHLSLVHHYRIHKRGLRHVAFRKNYMSQLRALLPVPVAQPVDGVLSPTSTGPGSLCLAGSAEFVGKSPRTTRRAKRWVRPVRVVETSVGDLPVLTLQHPSAVQGGVVFDCRPPLLPVSLDLSGIGLRRRRPVWKCLPVNMAYRSVGGGGL